MLVIGGAAWASAMTGVLSLGPLDALIPQEDSTQTVREARFGVAKTSPADAQALETQHPADLKTPSNVTTRVEYDYRNQRYLVRTMVGEQQIGYTIPMSEEDYMKYTERLQRFAYFHEKNQNAYEESEGEAGGLDLLDMQFSLGPAEKLFGKGGIRVRTSGSASISMGFKNNKIDNPTLSQRARNQTTFDFKEDFQLNMKASIGEKMSFDLNYNTEATFDFDANKFKLAFGGDEDDIIQTLEAGNVSMTTGNSLISGGSSLFGIKTGLKFGKLNITALLAKQESSSKTVSSKGGATKRTFELAASAYDENRHFFLAQYFRDTYDQNMSRLPLIASGVEITKIEVWVTNKKSSYDNARNIIAFEDLGEADKKASTLWQTLSSTGYPENKANTLYETITGQYASIRDITQVTTSMSDLEGQGIMGGRDFEKVESARLLSSSEYTLNSALGYISLRSRLDDDMVLAVAYQYTKGGKTYQVGEFSTDNAGSTTQTLITKLIKATSGNPATPLWDLMMKNIYSLGVSNLQQSSFTMNVQYLSDTIGVYTNYINDGPIASDLLIKVMNLDRLNANQESYPDGRFDWVSGYTVMPATGRIIFPVVEPFGSHLAARLGNELLAERYCYNELYDSTLTVAEQIAEKNKFRLKGEYQASSGSEIDLGATNVAHGSVVVTAGGTTLVENSDYTVDYTMGVVTILNESIIESGTNVSVSLEDQSEYSIQRKTMMGVDMQYEWSKDLAFGASVINLREKPLTKKVSSTDIPINNTIYGFNLKWNKDFMWLTNAVGSIPWINATAPSNFSLSAEYAQLVAGHSNQIGSAGNVYLDDFENSETPTDISSPSQWKLCSTPYDDTSNALFPEAALSNNTAYGKNRALFNWYTVERLFTSQSSSLTPSYIKNDLEALSDHRVRQVNYDEIYPNKQLTYGETGILSVLNLSFYPQERGPYNVDTEGMDANGQLTQPERRWGGMMRAMDVTNFENANYEYIEFWMMDPFIMDEKLGRTNQGGDLYFNLGEISEDILKDGMKSFENGLDVNGDTTYTTTSVWGRVSRRTSTVYAFDNSTNSHAAQDVGLNGLSSANEKLFPTYRNYVETLRAQVNDSTLAAWQNDPFSPLNDPAGDDYHFYRGSDYDRNRTSILDRYKRFNGVEGNSPATNESPESYSTAATASPDVEDINTDNTLNEYERYYQYRVSLRPEDMVVGQNYINAVAEKLVPLRNGTREKVKWYQFRIPIKEYEKKVGAISNFKSIRFMRVFMTGWQQEQTLRMATLELVRSDWRTYTASSLADRGYAVSGTGTIAAGTVNIEENAGSYPVNYVLPPGIDRVVDPGQSTATQLNEQAMSLTISDLEPHDAVAVYKSSGFDMRRYERLQLFVHAEALIDNTTALGDGDLAVFIRLGSDYKDNYYEYEVPLSLTPAGTYNDNPSDRRKVWPEDNMINLELSKLTTLKKNRNAEKQHAGSNVSYTTLYTAYDSDNRQNRMAVIGNPSLSEVGVVMIGVRNKGKTIKSGKIWVNELRMNGIEEKGGWASRGTATLRVSDLATVSASGSFVSAGFGSIDQNSSQRSMSTDWEYQMSGQTDLGRWLPKQVKLSAPLYVSRSKATSTPEYDPYNEDLTLKETLDTYETKTQKDSIRDLVQTVDESRSMSLSGVRFNVKSQKSKPWDPANVTMSYSQNRRRQHNPTTEYEKDDTYKGAINYQWSPYFTPLTPFADRKSGNAARTNQKNKNALRNQKLLTDFQLNWLPNSISLSSHLNRTYHEEQLRNVETYETDYTIPVTYSKTFTWMRQTAISWDLTKTIKLNFQAATNARINEPDAPVNKNLYPDEYEAWKDTIAMQLWKLGTPVDYNQTFDGSWQVPINKISYLDWVTSSIRYRGTYQWQRGTDVDEATTTGNTIQNSGSWQFDGRFNLEMLYNKSKFLKKANDKYRTQSAANRRLQPRKTPARRQAKEFKTKLQLLGGDTTVVINHRLNTRRLILSAKNAETGKSQTLKFKKVDANQIKLHLLDSLTMDITIKADKPLDEEAWYKSLQLTSRLLMMVRSVQVGYKIQKNSYLPSFRPNAGDWFGQGNSDGLVPGLGFAFGFDGGEDFTAKALEKGWMISNDSLTTPAIYSTTKDMSYSAVLEPFPGLKINLTGSHKHNEKQTHQFMFEDMAITRSGSFQMTTIALGSSFGGGNSKKGYSSKAFDDFLAARQVIYSRLLSRYEGARYPNSGFMSDYPTWAGTAYEGPMGSSRLNSSDVLVPAFISAYMGGGSASDVSLSPFPSLLKALPNWRVTYDGLLQLFPKLSKWFKQLSLSHAYNCTYAVGSYQTYTNYVENEQGLGFMLDVTNDVPVPSSQFDISTVTLTESFAPLIGLNATFHNGLTTKTEWKQTRSVSLNMSAAQIVESISKDLTVGLGYKVADFGTKIGLNLGNGNGKSKISHDLNLKFDVTHRNQVALLRKIEDVYTEATSGTKAWTFKFSADYQFSKMLSLRLYYDRQTNTPLISTSYPTVNSNFGMTMSFSLTR